MKKLLAVLLTILAGLPGFALDVNGEFEAEFRFSLDDGAYLFNQENGSLAFVEQVDDNLFAAARLRFRYYNSPLGLQSGSGTLSSGELSVLSAIGPVEISLDEAYFVFSDFLISGLDFSAGIQRIRWGSADVLNPTDIVNPLDLSDPFDFGKKMTSLALLLSYTIPGSDAFVALVWEPFSPVARLNPLVTAEIEAALVNPPVIIGVEQGAGSTVTPEPRLPNSLFGVRIGAPLAGFDLSANFVTRMNDVPLVDSVNVSGVGGTVIAYTLSYYREYAAGADAAKDWDALLTWAEVEVFWQDKQTTLTDISGAGSTEATALAADPYVKYTVGLDTRFGGSLFYLNFQFNHGFFMERGESGPGRLQDYLLLRIECTPFEEKWVIGLTGMLNVNNLSDAFGAADFFGFVADHYGAACGLDLAYKPSLSLEVKAGVMLFDGTADTRIGTMKDRDFFFFSCAFSF